MSASVRPSSPATTWRAAVIGIVAVLSVGIGIALGGFLLDARSPEAMGTAASYVPADAPFYVEMRIEPSADQDAALREFLGHFPPIEGVDLGRPLYDQLGELIDEELAEHEEVSLSWAEDVAPWFDGRIAVGITEIPIDDLSRPTDPMADPPVPAVILVVGVTDSSTAQATLDRLAAEAEEQGIETTTTEHDGVTIHVTAEEQGAYALTDDALLIAPTAEDVIGALDVAGDPSTSLGGDERVTAMAAGLPDDWLAFATYDFTELLAASFSEVEGTPAADAFAGLMEHQPMRGAMALSAAGDRIAGDAVSEAPTGPLAVENTDRDLAAEVPGDAFYFSDGGNIGASLEAFIEAGKLTAAEDPATAEQIETAEAALGAELEELVAWIDQGALAAGWSGSEPYAGFVLVPSDMDAAERRIGQLLTFANLATLDPSTGVSVDETDVAGTSVTTIRWEDPNAVDTEVFATPLGGIAIQVALTDDRALLGLGESFVGRVLELDAADSLAAEPRFADAVAELGPAANVGVAWVDIAGVLETVEVAVEPMLGMFDPDGVYQTEVKPWLLPLDRAVTVTHLDGDLLVQRSVLLVR